MILHSSAAAAAGDSLTVARLGVLGTPARLVRRLPDGRCVVALFDPMTGTSVCVSVPGSMVYAVDRVFGEAAAEGADMVRASLSPRLSVVFAVACSLVGCWESIASARVRR